MIDFKYQLGITALNSEFRRDTRKWLMTESTCNQTDLSYSGSSPRPDGPHFIFLLPPSPSPLQPTHIEVSKSLGNQGRRYLHYSLLKGLH